MNYRKFNGLHAVNAGSMNAENGYKRKLHHNREEGVVLKALGLHGLEEETPGTVQHMSVSCHKREIREPF